MTAPSAREAAIVAVLEQLLADPIFVHGLDALTVSVGELVGEFLADQGAALTAHVPSDEAIDYVLSGVVGWFLGSPTEPGAGDQAGRLRLRMFAAWIVAAHADRAFAAQRAREVH